MKELGTPLDAEVVEELKAMGRRGAETKDLATHIRATFGLEGDMHVPILAYLGRAFPVSLRVLLPMREEGFDGAYACAVQVALWLRVGIDDALVGTPGNRSFPNWNPVTWQIADSVTLEYCLDPAARSELYGRGTFRQIVAKEEEFRSCNDDIRRRIAKFILDFQKMLTEVIPIHSTARQSDVTVTCGFEINDNGPTYEVACIVQVIKGVSIGTPSSALQPTA